MKESTLGQTGRTLSFFVYSRKFWYCVYVSKMPVQLIFQTLTILFLVICCVNLMTFWFSGPTGWPLNSWFEQPAGRPAVRWGLRRGTRGGHGRRLRHGHGAPGLLVTEHVTPSNFVKMRPLSFWRGYTAVSAQAETLQIQRTLWAQIFVAEHKLCLL